jgi:hypothetical protein
MKSKVSMAGEDSKLAGTCYKLAGKFYDWKNEIPMKGQEFKRSGIRIIAGFCRFPANFPTKAQNSSKN